MFTWTVGLVVWVLLLRSLGSARWWAFFLAWPSTVLHELAHFVVALLTGSRPSTLALFPKRVPGGWLLGSVAFEARPFWAAWVALAPLFWAFVAAYWFAPGMPSRGTPGEFLDGLVLGNLLTACTPSRVDLGIAVRYPAGLLTVWPLGWVLYKLVEKSWLLS